MQRSRTDSKFFQDSYPSLLFESSLPDSDARRSAKLRWLNPFRSIKITTVSQAVLPSTVRVNGGGWVSSVPNQNCRKADLMIASRAFPLVQSAQYRET